MTTDSDFDRQIQDYLESGPAELSDRVLWAARAQLKTTRRRRTRLAWLTPWRNSNDAAPRRLLAGGGALVVAIGAGLVGSIVAQPSSRASHVRRHRRQLVTRLDLPHRVHRWGPSPEPISFQRGRPGGPQRKAASFSV